MNDDPNHSTAPRPTDGAGPAEPQQARRRRRLAIVVTHPIQYYVPIYRTLQAEFGIDCHAFFASDHSVRGGVDRGFGVAVKWDVPLLEGYESTFLPNRPLPLRPRRFFSYRSPSLGGAIRRGGFDALLVSGYDVAFYWQAIVAARRAGVPVLLRGDNTDVARTSPRPWWKRAARAALLGRLYTRYVSAGLAVGGYMARHFTAHGMPPERVFRSPHCVDNDAFRNAAAAAAPQRDALRRRLGLAGCDAVALFCGKVVGVKDPFVLTDALARMTRRRSVGLLVVGDGELRQAMEARVAAAGIGAYAFVGFKNQGELAAYYTAADFLVLPSKGESWGLVVNEAMNCARPAIVSDRVGCADDLVFPGETGYVFPAGDAQALAGAMDRIVGDPVLRETMGRNAAALVARFGVRDAAAGIAAAVDACADGPLATPAAATRA
jgi:glycosyltransferase involved in cell wall biosynthesis